MICMEGDGTTMAERPENADELIAQIRRRMLNRRQLLYRAGVLGASAAALRAVPLAAQDATPGATPGATPAATPQGAATPVAADVLAAARPISRDDYKAALRQAFPFEDPAGQGGTFIVGDSTDIGTTNLMLGSDDPTNPMLSLVFETLYGTSAIDASPVPGLADTWELAPDGITWTFRLNPNARWHDGQPVTAEDVAFSFSIQANPDTGSSYTSTFNDTVASWRVIDPQTIEVTATRVQAPIVFIYNAYAPIMPRHIWENVPPAQWANDPGSTGQDPSRVIGSGPFKFQEWVQGERLTLVRNEDYWDDVPALDTFIFQVWPDDASATEALRAGQIDTINGNIQPGDVESIQNEEALDVAIYPTYDFGFYAYNLDPAKTPLFQQREVRQALLYALDRQAIIDNILLGFGEVAHGSQSTLSPAYAPDRIETRYDYNPDTARQLLQQAGATDGDGDGVVEVNGQPLAFELMYSRGNATTDQIVAYMQEAWAEIGVQMTPNPVDFATALVPALTETYDYQVAFLGFSWDPTGDQTAMFSTDAYGGGFNFMRYSNPEVDRLFLEANSELDPQRRVDLLVQATNLVNNDLPVAVINFAEDRTGYAVRARNFFPNDYAGRYWSVPYTFIQEG